MLPIFLLRCNACHGPRLQQGGLDLRTHTGMLRGGNSGPALVPGDPDKSLLIQRIESQACPPSESLLKFFVRRPSCCRSHNSCATGSPLKAPARRFETRCGNHSSLTHSSAKATASTGLSNRPRWPDSGNSVDDFVESKINRRQAFSWSTFC